MAQRKPAKIDPKHPFAKLAEVKVHPPAAPASGAKGAGAPRPAPPRSAAAPKRPAPPSTLYDEEDRAAFALFIEGVTPLEERPMAVDQLGGGSAKHRARLEEEAALVSAAEDAVRAQLRSLVDPGHRFEVREDGRRVEGRRVELPIAKLGELRRGEFGVGATLDLHGMDLTEAREALVAFSPRPLLVAVTVLTSMDARDLSEVGFSASPEEQVLRLALLAKDSGLDGVVCSPREARLLREHCGPGFVLVTPGVRPSAAAADDQARIATPAEAIAAGAHYLVIGRPITQAADPVDALASIIAETGR